MLTSRQEKTCDKYRKPDEEGKVRCAECPLIINYEDKTCRAFMHWDRTTKKWEYDEDNTND